MSLPTQHPEGTASRARRWIVLAPALTLPLFASLFYFAWFPGTDFGNGFYKGIKFFELLWPLLATAFILRESLRRGSPGVIGRRRSLLIGAIFGVAVAILMLSLKEFTFLGEVLVQNGGRIRERVEDMGMLEHFILATIAIAVVHAALEEWFWRWFVFGNLRHVVPMPWAHIIAAIGFTGHHVVVLSQFFPMGFALFFSAMVGVGGAFWSWLYQRNQTLLGPWFSHMIVDFAIFFIGYRLLFAGS